MAQRKRGQVREAVLEALKENQNVHVTATDIMERTQLDRQQVNSTLARLAEDLKPYVQRVASGVYIYSPNAPEPRDQNGMYEGVGTTHDGDRVIRNEEGQLFIARPL